MSDENEFMLLLTVACVVGFFLFGAEDLSQMVRDWSR